MDADDYLSQYLPDFNTAEQREHLQQFNKEDLIETLLRAYKNARVMAMTADIYSSQMARIKAIAKEPSSLPSINRPASNFPE